MSCANWKPLLIGRLYGEIDSSEAAAVDAHLSACRDCRADLARLAETRESLRSSEPAVPPAPRMLVLTSRGSARSWWAFAAGIACAALLGTAALAAGYRMASREDATPAGGGGATVAVDPAVVRRLDALEARLARVDSPAIGGTAASTVTPDELQARLDALERRLKGARESDLEYMENYVLTQIAVSEQATGQRTREALKYVALASNPNLSER